MRLKSRLEKTFSDHLSKLGWSFLYEPFRIPYVVPATVKEYVPDFVIDPTNKCRIKKDLTLECINDVIILETKGVLDKAQRRKFELLKASHPQIDLRFIFPKDNYITPKRRKKDPEAGLKYSTWAEKHGFKYFIGEKPPASFLK